MKKANIVLAVLCAGFLFSNAAAQNSRLVSAFIKYGCIPSGSYVVYHAANYNNSISDWWRLSRVKAFHEEAKFFVKKNTREMLRFLKKGKEAAGQLKEDL